MVVIIDNIKRNCIFCVHYNECDLEAMKDHAYNLRDGTIDCFEPHAKAVPPWLNPYTECYGCMDHSYESCSKCRK